MLMFSSAFGELNRQVFIKSYNFVYNDSVQKELFYGKKIHKGGQ